MIRIPYYFSSVYEPCHDRQHRVPAREGDAALERAARRTLPRRGLPGGPAVLRLRAAPAARAGRPADRRDRAPGAAVEAVDDRTRAPVRGRRPRAPGA